MSEKSDKSEKVCSHHKHKWRKRLRKMCIGLLIFNFVMLVILLLVWAILQPRKPRFILQDVTVYAFNVSAPNFLTSSIGVTIFSRNPNHMIGVYYDKLNVYAAYQNQQITYSSGIPPAYQGHKDSNVWSPVLSGTNVPVAPYNTISFGQDQTTGYLRLTIKMDGRVRFKVNTYLSRRYHLYVKCPAFINLGGPSTGIIVRSGVKYQLSQRCSVTV
ncbi:LEA type 2 family protein [Klebsiella pneumoniae]